MPTNINSIVLVQKKQKRRWTEIGKRNAVIGRIQNRRSTKYFIFVETMLQCRPRNGKGISENGDRYPSLRQKGAPAAVHRDWTKKSRGKSGLVMVG